MKYAAREPEKLIEFIENRLNCRCQKAIAMELDIDQCTVSKFMNYGIASPKLIIAILIRIPELSIKDLFDCAIIYRID